MKKLSLTEATIRVLDGKLTEDIVAEDLYDATFKHHYGSNFWDFQDLDKKLHERFTDAIISFNEDIIIINFKDRLSLKLPVLHTKYNNGQFGSTIDVQELVGNSDSSGLLYRDIELMQQVAQVLSEFDNN